MAATCRQPETHAKAKTTARAKTRKAAKPKTKTARAATAAERTVHAREAAVKVAEAKVRAAPTKAGKAAARVAEVRARAAEKTARAAEVKDWKVNDKAVAAASAKHKASEPKALPVCTARQVKAIKAADVKAAAARAAARKAAAAKVKAAVKAAALNRPQGQPRQRTAARDRQPAVTTRPGVPARLRRSERRHGDPPLLRQCQGSRNRVLTPAR
jgi:colicin import membrane protein